MKININNLTKIYPNGNKAIHDISFEIESGMLGLLGPNGAGKSTLMRILATLMEPSSGDVKINGFDLISDRDKVRKMLGFLPQDFSNFPKISTSEFLDYSAKLSGIRNKNQREQSVSEMLKKVGLFKFRDRFANKLSGGMKRRLGIAQALIGNPQILIVDEPTTGLDPEERIRFRNLLSNLSHEEIIIILSTHIVGDISSTCQQMVLLNRGELKFMGAPDGLIEKARGHVFSIKAFDSDLMKIKEEFPVIATLPTENGWEVEVVAEKIDGYNYEEIEPNLEHAYMYFMEFILEEEIEYEQK